MLNRKVLKQTCYIITIGWTVPLDVITLSIGDHLFIFLFGSAKGRGNFAMDNADNATYNSNSNTSAKRSGAK